MTNVLTALLLAGMLAPDWLTAQAQETRTVRGRVMRASVAGEAAVRGQIVVLHRIGSDSAGPLDSMRTGADGGYRFTYRALGSDAMYIVSARHHGVAYFTPPLRDADVRGDAGAILVFDTTSGPVPLHVRGRHLVLTAPAAGGARRVVDVFEIANDSSLTKVAGADGASWSVRLPAGARDPAVGRGDVPADAVRFDEGTARVIAPFAPGLKQLVLTYEVPASAFPLRVGMESVVSVFEVLLEGSGGEVAGAPLSRQEPVTLEGKRYERYLGQDVPAGGAVSVAVSGGARGGGIPASIVVVLAAAGVLALGVVAGRRARHGSTDVAGTAMATLPEPSHAPEALAAAIGALDNLSEGSGPRDDATRAAYARRRAELKTRLIAALATAERAPAGSEGSELEPDGAPR